MEDVTLSPRVTLYPRMPAGGAQGVLWQAATRLVSAAREPEVRSDATTGTTAVRTTPLTERWDSRAMSKLLCSSRAGRDSAHMPPHTKWPHLD